MSTTSVNLYDTTVPIFINSLTVLSQFLKKAAETASSKSLDPATLPEARLIADMRPLTFQISSACNTAKWVPVRLTGAENEVHEDTEKTFEDMQARIEKTVAFLKKSKKEDFVNAADADVEFFKFKFKGLEYVQLFAIPNFFFHVVTAYDILRSQGLELGKMDFLGDLRAGRAKVEE